MQHETKGYIAVVLLATFATVALLVFIGRAMGQWGVSRGPVGPAVVVQPAPRVAAIPDGWKPHPANSRQFVYWQGGAPVGLYCTTREIYWQWNSRTAAWGATANPPTSPPCPHRSAESFVEADSPKQDFGVGWRADPKQPEKFSIGGVEVDRRKAFEAIGAGVPDDSGLRRVTVIGSEAECKQVSDAIATAPELAAAKGQLIVQCYRPDHWAVADTNFKRDGKPTVYIQAAGGKVLHRQDEWRGPAKFAEAVRKSDPSYDPKKDPDLNKQVLPVPPLPGPSGPDIDLSKLPKWVWGVLGGAAVLLLMWFQQNRSVSHAVR